MGEKLGIIIFKANRAVHNKCASWKMYKVA